MVSGACSTLMVCDSRALSALRIGVSALIAAMHGYLADCTTAASRYVPGMRVSSEHDSAHRKNRVRVFSLFFG